MSWHSTYIKKQRKKAGEKYISINRKNYSKHVVSRTTARKLIVAILYSHFRDKQTKAGKLQLNCSSSSSRITAAAGTTMAAACTKRPPGINVTHNARTRCAKKYIHYTLFAFGKPKVTSPRYTRCCTKKTSYGCCRNSNSKKARQAKLRYAGKRTNKARKFH